MRDRVVTGDGMRKTRFHDYEGWRLDLAGLAFLPHCVATTALKKLFGVRPELPWLGYRAIRRLAEIIQPDWTVLEYGSGMSTLWLARRCARLVSIENDADWYALVRSRLTEARLRNVDYQWRTGEDYHELGQYPDRSFDLVIVDGVVRDRCMKTAVAKVKPSGYVYLDNSDVPYGEHRDAKATLLEAASPRVEPERFVDLYPTQIVVNQGILVRVA